MKLKYALLCLFVWPVAFGCNAAAPVDAPVSEPVSAPVSENAVRTFPKEILLIRHAEKPPPEAMDVHLTDAGKKRANALVNLFEKSDARTEPFAKPDFLFATKNTMKSHRPNETVAELAKSLNLKVNDHYENDNFAALAKQILTSPKYAGKTLLICWHHGNMPAFAKALGVTNPPDWKPTTFDRVWEIQFDDEGKATLKDLPQRLLLGDKKK